MSLVVEQRRGGLLETVHPVSARLVRGGVVREEVGPDLASFWRSASKPMQLVSSLSHLPVAVVDGLDDLDLALGAASHSAQPFHVARVEALLRRFGLEARGLRCGAHAPMHEASARALFREGREPTALHNNCSGKHTFMLAASAAQGWAPDYRPPDHPLQVDVRARLSRWMDHAPGSATDGCGVPTFHAPLSAMARAWSVLAECAGAPTSREQELAGRILGAMRREPEGMSGEGRLDLAVVRAAVAPLTVKIGAEGLFCIADADGGAGVAVKVHTGNADALAVAVRAVLDRWLPGALGPAAWPWDEVHNVVGDLVGERRAVWA